MMTPPRRRQTTYDVRIWSVRKFTNKSGTSYRVRWLVAGKETGRSFPKKALADRFRSDLMAATSRGELFDLVAKLPLSMLPDERDMSWWEWSQTYVDLKWPSMAPKSRRSMAEALTTATMALPRTDRVHPPEKQLRSAMLCWAYVPPRRAEGPPPDRLVKAVDWLTKNTVRLADLEDPGRARAVLDALAVRLDGRPAAGTTVARKRAVLFNCFELAVEHGLLTTNPLARVRWRAPKVNEQRDPASVVNPSQARDLIAAVGLVGTPTPEPEGPSDAPGAADKELDGAPLVAMFGCMYYSAMRPSEALSLRSHDLQLPDSDDEWGTIRLARSNPNVAGLWTDNGHRQARQLKHRAIGAVRPVPCPPELVRLLRAHIRMYGVAQDGRLFRGPNAGSVRDEEYLEVWQAARRRVLPDADTSPLARRPYDLRHACVSTWLAGGVDSTQVAVWAGHSVAVLHRVYAHVLHGREDIAKRRIEDILRTADENESGKADDADGDEEEPPAE